MGMNDLPALDDLLRFELDQATKTGSLLRHVHAFQTLASTSDHALALEREQLPSGTVVAAARQTGGRGRFGRSWWMREGDIAISLILRRENLPENPTHLAMIPALAVTDALQTLKVNARLKWPNDIVAHVPHDDAPLKYCAEFRKLGGVLVDNVYRDNALSASIIGIGLNIMENPDLKREVPHAAALRELMPTITRQIVLKQLLTALENRFLSAAARAPKAVVAEYRALSETLGKMVTITRQDHDIIGYAKHIDDNGSLIVDDGKEEHIVSAGEVTIAS